MKKALLILGLSCIAFFSKAQNKKTEGYLLANGGVNYASLYANSKYADETSGIFAPEIGLSFRVKYPTYWGFEAGAYYSMKGVKFKNTNEKVTLNYGGVFVNGLLFFPLANNDNIYIGAGFYALHAFSGTTKSDTTSSSSSINFGETWKRFDGGIQLKAAYEIKNIVALGLHYDIGVFKTFSSTDPRGNDFNGRNSVLTVFASVRLAKLFAK